MKNINIALYTLCIVKYHVSYIACSVHFKSKFMGPFQRRFMGQGVGCSRGDQQATGPMRLLLWMEFLNWKIPRNAHIRKPRSAQRYGHFNCNQNASVDAAVRIYVYHGLTPTLLLPATYLYLYIYILTLKFISWWAFQWNSDGVQFRWDACLPSF